MAWTLHFEPYERSYRVRFRTDGVLQVVVNLADFDMTPAAAVAAPRLHVEDGAVDMEPGLPAGGDAKVWPAPSLFFGGVHVAARAPDGAVAGAGDGRRDGVWQRVSDASA